MFRHGLFIALSLTGATAGAAPPAIAAPPTHVARHVPDEQVAVRWLAGRSLEVDAGCVACLDDVRVAEWTSADGSQRRAVRAAFGFAARAANAADRDVATLDLELASGRAFAVDVTVAWHDDAARARETTRTYFGRLDRAGRFEALSWLDFVVARGYGRVATARDGSTRLELVDAEGAR